MQTEEKSKLTSRKSPSHIEPSSTAKVYVEPKGRKFALQIVAAQVVVTGFLSLVGLMCSNQVAIAILSGGMICSLANFWLATVAFRPALGKPPGQMLAAFYVGEIGKFIITAVLFLIAFKKTALLKQPTYALLLFAAYALVQCTTWAYPLARSKFYQSRWTRRR
jgi:ATP synthase protein I